MEEVFDVGRLRSLRDLHAVRGPYNARRAFWQNIYPAQREKKKDTRCPLEERDGHLPQIDRLQAVHTLFTQGTGITV